MGIEPTDIPSNTGGRIHGLDLLRGILMLLGIVLHCAMRGEWYDHENAAATAFTLTGIVDTIHTFRMPAFFLISGFFGALLWQKRGAGPMMGNRVRRILWPFLVFLVVLWPIVVFCGALAISVDGVALAPTAWKSKKARDVCALLADAGQHGLRREQVIEAIWTGRDPHKGRSLLRTALTEIRRVLEPRRGTGQESRFVTTVDDRVVVLGDTDLARADRLRGDDPSASFALLALGPAGDGPDADWFDAVATRIDRARVDAASRVAADPLSAAATRVQALEVLLDAEPWQRAHFRALADLHRELGDDHAADDVDRRWFADD